MLCQAALFLAASILGGSQQPIPVAAGIVGAKEPQAAYLKDGRLVVTFGAGDSIYFVSEAFSGKGFGAPVLVGKLDGFALGKRRGPRIAVVDRAILITASSSKGHMGGDLWAFASTDGGATWAPPQRINSEPKSAPEGLHAMASFGDSNAACVWLDNRNKHTELWYAETVDAGRSWKQDRLLYRSPGGNICECCHPSLAAFGGEPIAMWRNSVDGNRDMYLAGTSGNGLPPRKLGVGAWKLDACPMDGGALAIDASGKRYSAWRRQDRVYVQVDGQPEVEVGSGEQPWIAAGKSVAVVWVERRNGRLLLRLLDRAGALLPTNLQLADAADDPMIAAAPNGSMAIVFQSPAGPMAIKLST